MNVGSLIFVAACAMAAILFQLLPKAGLRRWFFCALNAGFFLIPLLVNRTLNAEIWKPLVPNRRSWICFALFLVGTYLIVKMAKARPSRWVVGMGIGVVLVAFVIVKRYAFVHTLIPINLLWEELKLVELVGLSYMLFKFIHVLVDQAQGQIGPISFFSYVNYQLAFFTLLAGPIQRYNDFQRAWKEMDLPPSDDERETLTAWGRILIGVFKMVGVGSLVWYLYEEAGQRMGESFSAFTFGDFAIYFYAYPVFMYFNFSGYTDIAIGTGRLFGFRVPENFNRPYLARNVIDFWNRWHMTLTAWIRDYVFMTSYKVAAERFPRSAKYFGYFLLFFALFLSGVWHGSTYGFAAFGMINGVGAAVNQLYGDTLKARLGRQGFQNYLKNRWIELAAIVATLHYFFFSMLFFSSDLGPALQLLERCWHHLHTTGLLPLFSHVDTGLVVYAAIMMTMAGLLYYKNAFLNLNTYWSKKSLPFMYGILLTGAFIVVLICMVQSIVQQKDPVIIYQGF